MYDLSDEDERKILGEALDDKLQAILEYVSDIPEMKDSLRNIDERLCRLEFKFDSLERVIGHNCRSLEADERKWRQLAKSLTKIAA